MYIEKIRIRNFKSIGGKWEEIEIGKNGLTLIAGSNGFGKCLDHSTKLNICVNDNIKEKYNEWKNKRNNR